MIQYTFFDLSGTITPKTFTDICTNLSGEHLNDHIGFFSIGVYVMIWYHLRSSERLNTFGGCLGLISIMQLAAVSALFEAGLFVLANMLYAPSGAVRRT